MAELEVTRKIVSVMMTRCRPTIEGYRPIGAPVSSSLCSRAASCAVSLLALAFSSHHPFIVLVFVLLSYFFSRL